MECAAGVRLSSSRERAVALATYADRAAGDRLCGPRCHQASANLAVVARALLCSKNCRCNDPKTGYEAPEALENVHLVLTCLVSMLSQVAPKLGQLLRCWKVTKRCLAYSHRTLQNSYHEQLRSRR